MADSAHTTPPNPFHALNEARLNADSAWRALLVDCRETREALERAKAAQEGIMSAQRRHDEARTALEYATAPTIGELAAKCEALFGRTHGVTADLYRHLYTPRA